MSIVVEPERFTGFGKPICPRHTQPMAAWATRDFETGIARLFWRCPGGCLTAALPLPEDIAAPLEIGPSRARALR